MEILQFKKGGHYAFLKHATTVNQKVEFLLKKALTEKLQPEIDGRKSFDFETRDYQIAYDCNESILKDKEETEKLVRNVRLP